LRTADKIICVSEATKRHFASRWSIDGNKIVVIANGVDTDKFGCGESLEAARNRLGLDDGPVVVFVGGFQPWHGLELLVEAFAGVVDKCPGARLVLVGDGPARPDVERKIDGRQLGKSVLITGYVKHKDIPGWLAAADVAVAPYPPLPEELWFSPLKLYEYMAAGKAIVASEAGQIAEVIRHGHNGVLVQPGNTAQLAQAMIDLLDDPDQRRRLGENARQQATAEHSWAGATQQLEKLYQTVF
jgi:glycosyltransferase involved in cell wall biosynthesis